MAQITRQDGVLKVSTPFKPSFVDELKTEVPYSDRSWQKPYWIVTEPHFAAMQQLVRKHFGSCDIVDNGGPKPMPTQRTILIEYLGRCKSDASSVQTDGHLDFSKLLTAQKQGGVPAYANAFADGGWTVRFSEKVLRAFFEGFEVDEAAPRDTTFYGLLGVKKDCSPEELKRGYFRASKTWHPDISGEPDATERFIQIKEAYTILADETQRVKYDAGLKLEARQKNSPSWHQVLTRSSDYGYRAPATCGIVTCIGMPGFKFNVSQILNWDDDFQQVGWIKLMRVATWKRGEKSFKTTWEPIP